MAHRTSGQALAWALAESLRPTLNFDGYCLRAVRTMYGVAARWPNANAAWEAVEPEDRHRTMAPPGSILWWDVGRYGHVALACGNGICWSTDILRRGKIDVVPEALVARRWGAVRRGWTDTLNGVRVFVR